VRYQRTLTGAQKRFIPQKHLRAGNAGDLGVTAPIRFTAASTVESTKRVRHKKSYHYEGVTNVLVLPSRRKLVLKAHESPEIGKYIPHAKSFQIGGEDLVAIPHGAEETKVLRNMGFSSVPPPIKHYYDWPARFPPMEHQKETAAFLSGHNRALCLNAPGTGKTISTLWAADFLMKEGIIANALIIAPLSTVRTVWGKEIVHHMPHRTFEVIYGTREKRKEKLEQFTADFAIVNHDSFSTMPDYYKQFDLVIYDEATALKTPTSQRFKKFYKFMDDANPRLWLLTGTPISQNPTDAWTLAKLVNSPVVPRSFTKFKDEVMQRVSQFLWVPRPDALETCKAVLQPSIRFSLDECKDLPETVFIRRDCDMTKDQLAAMAEMERSAELVVNADVISAANAAVLFQKILQICCGVAYSEAKTRVTFDDQPRLETLFDIIDEIGGKCIVFVPLRGVQDHLAKQFAKRKLDYAVVHGDVGKNERDDIFNTFQNTRNIQVLLAHPKVAAHGLTLTNASSIIWYAPIHSLEMYEQANARIKRINTTGKTAIYHIASSAFEKELYYRLKTKQKVLTDVLALVRGINE
jgi:SNF2 family DNA or RNA helicase